MDCFKTSLYSNVWLLTALISEVIICGTVNNWIVFSYGVVFCVIQNVTCCVSMARCWCKHSKQFVISCSSRPASHTFISVPERTDLIATGDLTPQLCMQWKECVFIQMVRRVFGDPWNTFRKAASLVKRLSGFFKDHRTVFFLRNGCLQ